VILLGTWFAIAELTDGRWQSFLIHEDDTPVAARTTLTTYLRQTTPTWEKPGVKGQWELPGEETCAAYAQAADDLESAQLNEITAAARRFRVSRVERYVRTGPAGLEPPPALRPRPLPSPAA
jgi:Family of unknown function (DUF5954)